MFNSLYGTCGVPGLARSTVSAGGKSIIPASCGGVEWDLSVWPAVGVADSPMVG